LRRIRMNKSELIEELSMRMAIHPKKAENMVNTILNSMIEAMKNSRRVEIRGFGSFVMRDYKPYIGRNPKSGEKIQVQHKTLPFFKSGKDMRDRVNDSKK
jgi:integration host factor subunit beta